MSKYKRSFIRGHHRAYRAYSDYFCENPICKCHVKCPDNQDTMQVAFVIPETKDIRTNMIRCH